MASLSFITTGKLSELLNVADPKKSMYLHVLNSTRLAIGVDPLNPSAVIDLANETIMPFTEGPIKTSEQPVKPEEKWTSNPDEAVAWRAARRSGEYWLEVDGKRSEFYSLRDLLAGGLRTLEEKSPGTLEKLSHIKPRSRRIVARDPKDLFDKEHLAKEYAEKLADGWYYGTNNSAQETNAWLERAASCAGFKWDEKFKTSINSLDALAI